MLSSLNQGWQGYLFTLEVGVKGFVVSSSFYRFSNFLGLSSKESKALRDSLSRQSLRCSYIIWLNRNNKMMDKNRLTPLKIKAHQIYKRLFKTDRVSIQPSMDPSQQLLDLHKVSYLPTNKYNPPKPFFASFLPSLPNVIDQRKKVLKEKERLAAQALLQFYPRKVPGFEVEIPFRVFLPAKYISQLPHTLLHGYNIGIIKVHCFLSNKDIHLQCHDHGQYPLGHH